MAETYSSPKSNNGSDVKRNRLLVAALLAALGALACVALLMVNLMGYGVCFYTHTGNKDVILGAGIGVMHFAVGKPFEQWDSTPTYTPDLYAMPLPKPTALLEIGPFELFIEPSPDSIQPARFDLVRSDSHSAFEMPILLVIAVLGMAAFFGYKRSRNIS